jgi:hypothetical protein
LQEKNENFVSEWKNGKRRNTTGGKGGTGGIRALLLQGTVFIMMYYSIYKIGFGWSSYTSEMNVYCLILWIL